MAKHDAKDGGETQVHLAEKPKSCLGVRHFQTFLMFLGILLAYSLRVNLSVAIVAMVDKESANPNFPEYDWSQGTRAIILSSFFWGYVVSQLPAGSLAERFGPKPLLVLCLGVSSLFTLLTPGAAAWGDWSLVCAFRVIQGLSQGFLFPSMHTLCSRWVPKDEQGFLVTFVYAGAQLGTVIALPVSGVLATSSAGWPSCFYVFGSFGVAWTVVWFFFGSNSPAEHGSISVEERAYIEGSIGIIHQDVKPATPWRALLTSMPVWAVVAANCGHGWGFWTLLSEMPTFMDSVLGFNLQSNGLLSALPYLAMFILSFVFSYISDIITNRNVLSTTASRKTFNTIGLWGPALALIGVAFSTDSTVAIALLTTAVGLNSAIYVGFNVNHIDLAPNFAGTMMGISNGLGNLMSLIGPLVVGAVVTESGSMSQWQIVFFIAAGVYLVTNSFYLIFASSVRQPWNDPPPAKISSVHLATISKIYQEKK